MRISYSKLTTYLNCARGYKYQYEDKLQGAPTDEFHAYLGSVTQYVFEQVTNRKIYAKTTFENFVEIFKRELKELIQQTTYDMLETKPEEPTTLKLYQDLQVMQIDYMAHTPYEIYEEIIKLTIPNLKAYWQGQVMGNLSDIICEEEIKFEETTSSGVEYNMIGYADFLLPKHPKGITIIDGKKNYKPENHKPEQIGMYLWSMRDKPINLEGQFWSYKTGKFHKVQIDLKKVKSWMDNTVDFITDAQITGKFPVATSDSACFFCAFKDICVDRPKPKQKSNLLL